MTTRAEREADTIRQRDHELERFRSWVAGYLTAHAGALEGAEVEQLTAGDPYLPAFAIRRGELGLVVHIDPELTR